MLKLMKSFCADESGATAIEYGLIATFIALGIVASLQSLEAALTTLFGTDLVAAF